MQTAVIQRRSHPELGKGYFLDVKHHMEVCGIDFLDPQQNPYPPFLQARLKVFCSYKNSIQKLLADAGIQTRNDEGNYLTLLRPSQLFYALEVLRFDASTKEEISNHLETAKQEIPPHYVFSVHEQTSPVTDIVLLSSDYAGERTISALDAVFVLSDPQKKEALVKRLTKAEIKIDPTLDSRRHIRLLNREELPRAMEVLGLHESMKLLPQQEQAARDELDRLRTHAEPLPRWQQCVERFERKGQIASLF